MFSVLTSSQIFTIAIATIAFYGLIIAFVYLRKYLALSPKPLTVPVSTSQSSLIGPVISSPVMPLSPAPVLVQDGGDDGDEVETDEWFDEFDGPDADLPSTDEQYSTLLKEAERVVEQIQQAVDTVTQRPADPEEVFSKVHAIVSEYNFFFDTDYYDAINRFVAVTVHRDCDIELSEDDLKALWYAAAA